MLAERIKNELTKRFNESNNNIIHITMKKSGDTVRIERCTDNKGEFFDLNIDRKNHDIPERATNIFRTSMDSLVKTIMEYDQMIEDIRKDVEDLNTFREKHIDGHTVPELKNGNMFINTLIHEGIDINDIGKISEDPSSESMYTEAGLTMEEGVRCVALALDWQFYSDWYKSVYNVRPHGWMNENTAI